MAEEVIPSGPWYIPGKWLVTPYNFEEEVVKHYDLPERVFIRDVTLAEGQHAIGTNYTLETMVEGALALEEAGIPEIKQHSGDFRPVDFIQAVTPQLTTTKISILMGSGSSEKLIDSCIDAGVDHIEILSSTNEILDITVAKNTVVELIEYIKERGVEASIGINNTMIIPFNVNVELFNAGIEAGVDRIEAYDSTNPATPDAARYFVAKLKKAIKDRVPILWQSHNMFGLGTACTCGAVAGGAIWIDLSMNGLGDMGGNASLEETALILESMYRIKTGVKLEKLWELSKLFQELSGVKVQTYKPIVGKYAFSEYPHGLYQIDPVIRYRPFGHGPLAPEVVGTRHERIMGPPAYGLIEPRLVQLKLQYNERDLENIIKKLMDMWTKEKKAMTLEEFDVFAKKILSR